MSVQDGDRPPRQDVILKAYIEVPVDDTLLHLTRNSHATIGHCIRNIFSIAIKKAFVTNTPASSNSFPTAYYAIIYIEVNISALYNLEATYVL